jgi:hypothetical protein
VQRLTEEQIIPAGQWLPGFQSYEGAAPKTGATALQGPTRTGNRADRRQSITASEVWPMLAAARRYAPTLNPAVITAIPIPFVTVATVMLARRRVRRHGNRGPSGDEHGTKCYRTRYGWSYPR